MSEASKRAGVEANKPATAKTDRNSQSHRAIATHLESATYSIAGASRRHFCPMEQVMGRGAFHGEGFVPRRETAPCPTPSPC